nr:LacI family DNA-binding transcriptional regulator [Lacticaseibacillus paracasei]
MTVSRVLHHPEQVSDEVRQAVQQAISKLGYKPSPSWTSLSQPASICYSISNFRRYSTSRSILCQTIVYILQIICVNKVIHWRLVMI